MSKNKVTVNGIILDIEGDGGVIITANNPLNFSFGRSFRTYTIKVLNTTRNNEALDQLFNKSYQLKRLFSAEYEVENIKFFGVLNIISINKRKAEAQFISGVKGFWESLGDIRLRDLDFTDTRQITVTNVQSQTGNVTFDFAWRGAGFYQEIGGISAMNNHGIEERLPMYNVKRVIEKIFDGFTIDQQAIPSALYDSIRTSGGEPKILVEPDFIDKSQTGQATTAAALTLPQATTSNSRRVFLDNANIFQEQTVDSIVALWSQTGSAANDNLRRRWFIERSGAIRFTGLFKFTLRYASTVNEPDWRWVNRVLFIRVKHVRASSADRWVYVKRLDYPTSQVDQTFVNMVVNEVVDTKVFHVEAGDYLEVEIRYSNSLVDVSGPETIPVAATEAPQSFSVLNKLDSFFQTEGFAYKAFEATVDKNDYIPDWTVSQFMRNFLTIFNCELYFNFERRLVSIISRDTYNAQKIDITDNIIEGTIRADIEQIRRNYNFSFAKDNNTWFERQTARGRNNGDLLVNKNEEETFNLSVDWIFPLLHTEGGNVLPFFADNNDAWSARKLPYIGILTTRTRSFTLHRPVFTTDPNTSTPTTTTTLSTRRVYDFTDYSFTDLYPQYFEGTVKRLEDAMILECEAILDYSFINDWYYLTGKDLRQLFTVNMTGYSGNYQIIEAEQIEGLRFKLKMIRYD